MLATNFLPLFLLLQPFGACFVKPAMETPYNQNYLVRFANLLTMLFIQAAFIGASNRIGWYLSWWGVATLVLFL